MISTLRTQKKYNSISIFFAMVMLNVFSISYADNSIRFHSTDLVLSYVDGKCSVFFWNGVGESKKRYIYDSKPNKVAASNWVYCSVQIPADDFDKLFKYCALTGLANLADSDNRFSVALFGGKDHPDNVYYFEWKDAAYTMPRYTCINN